MVCNNVIGLVQSSLRAPTMILVFVAYRIHLYSFNRDCKSLGLLAGKLRLASFLEQAIGRIELGVLYDTFWDWTWAVMPWPRVFP